MPDILKGKDLRTYKTRKSLMDAMSELLRIHSFARITVNELCAEALISRTAFYSHFNDKYDLLKHWLIYIEQGFSCKCGTYDDIAECINDCVHSNGKIIRNVLDGANAETIELLGEFILLLLNSNVDDSDNKRMSADYIVLSKFCIGGIMNYVKWQAENKFSTGIPIMNPCIYSVLQSLQQHRPNGD